MLLFSVLLSNIISPIHIIVEIIASLIFYSMIRCTRVLGYELVRAQKFEEAKQSMCRKKGEASEYRLDLSTILLFPAFKAFHFLFQLLRQLLQTTSA